MSIRTRVSSWRNQRADARGKRDVVACAGDAIASRLPVLRDRENPATGWPHRDDQKIGRARDQSRARRKAYREFLSEYDREQSRLQRASDRQNRQTRREGRS